MRNDNHLDPDKSGMFEENWGVEFAAITKALDEHDTGRWEWDKITCCLTGKDADLEPWGDQGIELVSVDEDGVTVVIHGLKTHCGLDCSFNEPADWDHDDDDKTDKLYEIFMEQAQGVIDGTWRNYFLGEPGGEWDGDSWVMTFEAETKVPWVLDDKSAPDFDKTAQAVVTAANEVIKPWENEMVLANTMMNQLAGFRDRKNERCEDGKPDMEVSVFNPIYWGHHE